MNCQQIEHHTVDFLANQLQTASRLEFEAHLAACDCCRKSVSESQDLWDRLGTMPSSQPSGVLRAKVSAMIAAYGEGMKPEDRPPAKQPSWLDGLLLGWPLRPAYLWALLAMVFALGFATKSMVGDSRFQDPGLVQLRGEVTDLRKMVTLTLLQQPSPSDRLEGVNWSYRLPMRDEQILTALLHALESDANVNVRVAAVDALRQFADTTVIRQGLLRSLEREEAPFVQIELINLMVEVGAKESIPLLQKIMRNQAANLAVRQHAEWGLHQLT
jgi:hypothetical protein